MSGVGELEMSYAGSHPSKLSPGPGQSVQGIHCDYSLLWQQTKNPLLDIRGEESCHEDMFVHSWNILAPKA